MALWPPLLEDDILLLNHTSVFLKSVLPSEDITTLIRPRPLFVDQHICITTCWHSK